MTDLTNLSDKDMITWLTTYEPPAVQDVRDWFSWMRGADVDSGRQLPIR